MRNLAPQQFILCACCVEFFSPVEKLREKDRLYDMEKFSVEHLKNITAIRVGDVEMKSHDEAADSISQFLDRSSGDLDDDSRHRLSFLVSALRAPYFTGPFLQPSLDGDETF